MMRTKFFFSIIGIIVIFFHLCVLISCKKDSTTSQQQGTNPPPPAPDTDTQSAMDYSLSMGIFSAMVQICDEASNGSVSDYKTDGYEGILSHCATIKFDTLNAANADTITVDFGSINCLGHDSRYRRGKIFISYGGSVTYWDSLAQISITTTPDNSYFVNDNQVIGTITIINNGHISNRLTRSISENGLIIKPNNQGTITWNCNLTHEVWAGENTPTIWLDDEYHISGTASGTLTNGAPFTAVITNSLIMKMVCRWLVSGAYDITPGNKSQRHVDYSPPNNGQCDNLITVTINSNTYTVYLQ